METVNDRIRLLVSKNYLTRQEFAERVGIQPKTVTNYLSRNMNPSPKVLSQILVAFPTLNPDWLAAGEGDMYITDTPNEQQESPLPARNGNPYYNVSFTCGFDSVFNADNTTPDDYIYCPNMASDVVWCNASGDSMLPTITSGDLVALKPVSSLSQILYGEVYAIVTDDIRTIKRILKSSRPDHLRLVPDNRPLFEEQEIPAASILHLFKLVASTHKY